MDKKYVNVKPEIMAVIKELAKIIQDEKQPISNRRIAKFQYEKIIKQLK